MDNSDATANSVTITWHPAQPNFCPGCGRCRTCGQPQVIPMPAYPQPQPQEPFPPWSPSTPVQPWTPWASPFWYGSVTVTC